MSYKQSYMLAAMLVIALAVASAAGARDDCEDCKELVLMGKRMAPAFRPTLKQYCHYLGDQRQVGTCVTIVDQALMRLAQSTPATVCQLLAMCPGGKWVQIE